MMKTKISKNLISFPLVLRGNWHIKASIYKGQVLVVANHVVIDQTIIKSFDNNDEAVKFINFIVEKGYYE
jgi:hypothetical protein